MQYVSTRGRMQPVGFAEAVRMGLARDGGLLLPERVPDVSAQLADWAGLAFRELAFRVARRFADLPEADLRERIGQSYAAFDHPEVTPVRALGDLYLLELFHGPTLSFKDIALQFLGNLFTYLLRTGGGRMNILAATSGDTGSAAIYGVRGREGIRILVLHPHGRVSPIQERQMTTVPDANVFNVAIRGTFDDCQRIVKTIFNDLSFRDAWSLGAVNSINWARLLAQVVYYFYAGLRVMAATSADSVSFAVPTGNFGDLFAGYLAARMGLPVRRLVLATNENDILARFFASGEYRPTPVRPTISPAMDIQVASNFERYLYYRMGGDAAELQRCMRRFQQERVLGLPPLPDGRMDERIVAGSATEADTLATIREYDRAHGVVLDPHTAVGVHVASRARDGASPMVCLATAHPAKFPEAIRRALGRDPEPHPAIERLAGLPARCDVLPASVAAVREYIETRAGSGA